MERFWNKVNKTEKCWLWTASTRNGYGAFKFQGKVRSAHRVSFFLKHGKYPNDFACHTCDNKLCVNPDHLFDATHAENIKDAVIKGLIIVPRRRTNLELGIHNESTYMGSGCRCLICITAASEARQRRRNASVA